MSLLQIWICQTKCDVRKEKVISQLINQARCASSVSHLLDTYALQ